MENVHNVWLIFIMHLFSRGIALTVAERARAPIIGLNASYVALRAKNQCKRGAPVGKHKR